MGSKTKMHPSYAELEESPAEESTKRTHRVDASFVSGTDSGHSGGAGLGNQSQIRHREIAELRARIGNPSDEMSARSGDRRADRHGLGMAYLLRNFLDKIEPASVARVPSVSIEGFGESR